MGFRQFQLRVNRKHSGLFFYVSNFPVTKLGFLYQHKFSRLSWTETDNALYSFGPTVDMGLAMPYH